MKYSHSHFERLVKRVLRELPGHVLRYLDDVEVVIHDTMPARPPGIVVFGLYIGIPHPPSLSEWHRKAGVRDQIVLFREAFYEVCSSDVEVRAEIRRTIIHEIGHSIGLDEQQTHDWEAMA